MAPELSFIDLVAGASPLVQLVMAILLLASIVSWSMVFDRARYSSGRVPQRQF